MNENERSGLPLDGIRVVEFTHMVMGPTCGMILADLGAEVIKVEPPGGDKTRRLPGLGIGFFRSFNRNKKSVVVDIQSDAGRATARELIGTSDVVLENFRPGLMASLGLDHASLAADFPRLIYVSHKGFLPGPYEHRTALDEVVQMMGGLSYMTGPPGRPLRAGIGGTGAPVIRCCCMFCAERNTQFSNSALCTSWPRPVRSRSRSAARTPIAPNMPPMMSLTDVPARSGRPGGPVMYERPPIICTTSSSAVRCSYGPGRKPLCET